MFAGGRRKKIVTTTVKTVRVPISPNLLPFAGKLLNYTATTGTNQLATLLN